MLGKTVEPHNGCEEGVGGSDGGDICQRNKVGHLGEAVADDKDVAERSAGGQVGDEVHGDVSPWRAGHSERLEKSMRRVTEEFVALAGVAGGDKFVGIDPSGGPPEIGEDILGGGGDTTVTSAGVIMTALENRCAAW